MKNKTITIYELLGLIKDSKAPEKIKINDSIYAIDDDKLSKSEFAYKEINKNNWLTFDYSIKTYKLNEKVEILENTDDEFEDIDQFVCYLNIDTFRNLKGYVDGINYRTNTLIRNQKKIIERLNGRNNE